MKTGIKLFSTLYKCIGGLIILFASVSLTGCKEDINEGNFAIKSELTISDYLAANPAEFSSLKAILDRVNLSESENASSLTSVLAARGNYTIFAPTNEAIQSYVQTLGVSSVADLTYEQAKLIAYSCIIDNKDDSPYEEADFPLPGTFSQTNLNDRLISCKQEVGENEESYYLINGTSKVTRTNIELSNGMVHVVSSVIAPSSDNVYELIASADNMKIFAHLMEETAWADSMATPDHDVAYEQETRELTYTQSGVGGTFTVMQRRYLGYTAFVETDEVFKNELGIDLELDDNGEVTNWDNVMTRIQQVCAEKYDNGSDDLKDSKNAVNRFVAYHILKGKMAYDNFVHHYNEFNYQYGDRRSPQTAQMPTNVWDYYTTAGKEPGLMKITQLGDNGGDATQEQLDHSIYINRISTYNSAADGDYKELSAPVPGVKILPDNGNNDNNAQNGFYFPIDKMLWYDGEVRDALGNERIRIDITTMLPEVASNSMRGKGYFHFPHGYMDNISNESQGTVLLYLMDAYSPSGGAWRDYQGDEIMACGLYDFVLKLPPVPVSGMYELRMGASHNTMRGMAQIYFGTDPLRLSPIGLPYDMRQAVGDTTIPWVADGDDAEVNAENDKNMRNQGYMKGPQYFTVTNGKADQPVRGVGGSAAAVRRILTVERFEANKTYYLRFKSALKKLDAQLFLDYFEFVPTSVYNGTTQEDIW